MKKARQELSTSIRDFERAARTELDIEHEGIARGWYGRWIALRHRLLKRRGSG
jgi:hypothetical protein